MIKVKNREQLLMIVVGALVALFLLDRVIFTPLTNTWRRHTDEITKLRASIKEGQSLIDRERITRGIWDNMRKNTLPTNASQSEKTLLEAFDHWSRDSGITVSSIKPQWKRGVTDDYSQLECRVDASGNLDTLTHFIYSVEHTQMALRIESLELTARDTDGRQIALGLTVSGLRLSPLAEE